MIYRQTLLFCLLFLGVSSAIAETLPIEDHYFGATLFVVQTGQEVSPPAAVNNLSGYVDTYGQISGSGVDHGYQAARLFFANGGQTLYVIDPQGIRPQDFADALAASNDLPVDLVAIPGAACCSASTTQHAAIMSALSQHADASPNRFALIDAPHGSDTNALLVYRTAFSSEHSALYAPWVEVDGEDPVNSVSIPSSSAVAGIISRMDRQYGIDKTPAGPDADLKVPPVVDVARVFSNTDQGQLNESNVNLLGHFVSPLVVHIWGSRTTSDNSTRRYVSVSRLLRHLKFSISLSLATSLSGPPTSVDVSTTESLIDDYLDGYWRQGAFQGATSNQAYFVNCVNATTGINCTVGVSILKPAEFDVFEIAISYSLDIFESGFEENE